MTEDRRLVCEAPARAGTAATSQVRREVVGLLTLCAASSRRNVVGRQRLPQTSRRGRQSGGRTDDGRCYGRYRVGRAADPFDGHLRHIHLLTPGPPSCRRAWPSPCAPGRTRCRHCRRRTRPHRPASPPWRRLQKTVSLSWPAADMPGWPPGWASRPLRSPSTWPSCAWPDWSGPAATGSRCSTGWRTSTSPGSCATRSSTPSTPAPTSPTTIVTKPPPCPRSPAGATENLMTHHPATGPETHAHRDDHDNEHDHDHGSGRSVWSRARHVVAPHSHDAADSVDAALESSAQGIRAVKISLVALGVTAAPAVRRRPRHAGRWHCWPTPSTTSPTR